MKNTCPFPEFVTKRIEKHWQPGKKILDIGCGPGFLRSVFKQDYIGVDIIQKNAEVISSSIEVEQPPSTQGSRQGADILCSAENLEVPSDSIDIVLIKSALFIFDNIIGALQEAKRVLKKQGVLLVYDYNTRTQKMLCRKEGHQKYPCWTQWGLKQLIKKNGFNNAKLLLPMDEQPLGLRRCYILLYQEYLGTWAIVEAEK